MTIPMMGTNEDGRHRSMQWRRREEEEEEEEEEEDTIVTAAAGKKITLDGYVSLVFSVYIPEMDVYNVENIDDNDHTETRLADLLKLYLCSRPDIDLVLPLLGGPGGGGGGNEEDDDGEMGGFERVAGGASDLQAVKSVTSNNEDKEQEAKEDEKEEEKDTGGEKGRRGRRMQANENDVVSVCPYTDKTRRYLHRNLLRFLEEDAESLLTSTTPDSTNDVSIVSATTTAVAETTLLWSIPRIDSEIHTIEYSLFDDDDDDGTGDAFRRTIPFTRWKFTYPVYKHAGGNNSNGMDDADISESLQSNLDRSIARGTINSVLPWDGGMTSIIGQESYYFLGIDPSDGIGTDPSWNNDNNYSEGQAAGVVSTSSSSDNFYGTTMGVDNGALLQAVGCLIVLINLIVFVSLTVLARTHRKKTEERLRGDRIAKYTERKERLLPSRNNTDRTKVTSLNTEDGLAKMLSESKSFALTNQRYHSGSMMSVTDRSHSMNIFQQPVTPSSSLSNCDDKELRQAVRQNQRLLQKTSDHLSLSSNRQENNDERQILVDDTESDGVTVFVDDDFYYGDEDNLDDAADNSHSQSYYSAASNHKEQWEDVIVGGTMDGVKDDDGDNDHSKC